MDIVSRIDKATAHQKIPDVERWVNVVCFPLLKDCQAEILSLREILLFGRGRTLLKQGEPMTDRLLWRRIPLREVKMIEGVAITTMVTANLSGESREQADAWFDGFIKGVAMGAVIAGMPEAAVASLIDEANAAFRAVFSGPLTHTSGGD